MRKVLYTFSIALILLFIDVKAQTDQGITAKGALGEVIKIEQDNKYLTIKTDIGNQVAIILHEKTTYKRVSPEAKGLEGATDISLSDISVGDRLYAIGKVAEDKRSVISNKIIVMSRKEIIQKQEHTRAEWNRRGVHGVVTKIDPKTKEITISSRSREDSNSIIIVASSDSIKFRRYAQGSVKFSDAKPSSFSEMKVGDQLRALGDKSQDGTRFTPQEIVFGTFRTIGGTIISVDTTNNSVKINDIETKQPIIVSIDKDSTLRRIPPELGERMSQRFQNRGSGTRPTPSNAPSDPAGPQRDRPRMGGRGGDLNEMLERMPTATLTELKPGDMIVVSSTTNTDPSKATAIMLVAGVEPILKSVPQNTSSDHGPERGQGRSQGFGGGFDLGMGLP
jgi:hypothetical protein